MTSRYTFSAEPREDAYRQLITIGRSVCQSVLLVARPELGFDQRASETLGALEPYLLREEASASWPGTTLLSGEALVRLYRFQDEVLGILIGRAAALFEWQQPKLPEDLCLMRDELTPWMVTIAHEADAFVDLTPPERESMMSISPVLAKLLRQEQTQED
jgi:hypothetical protein